jgi:hypothetical protein
MPHAVGRLSEVLPQIVGATRASASDTPTTDNVSTTQQKPVGSYVVDTPNRTADNGGSAFVLPDFSITQRDAACRRSPVPTVGAVWRDWFWRPSSGAVSVDAASASGGPPSARSRLIGAVGWAAGCRKRACWRLSRGPERRCPFWLWRVWAGWAWDLCLYLVCTRPDRMGADPERRRWHGQD